MNIISSRDHQVGLLASSDMGPSEALTAVETALRLAIRQVLGHNWPLAPGAPDAIRLEQKETEEAKRRDGVILSGDSLDYAEFHELTTFILKNWEKFKPVFDDKKRTEVFFGVLEDLRNGIAHSRPLVPHEKDLVRGIVGLLRNQVSLYRGGLGSTLYYPRIERVTDSFGRMGAPWDTGSFSQPIRLDVGQPVTFDCSAFHARRGLLRWWLAGRQESVPTSLFYGGFFPERTLAFGSNVRIRWKPKIGDVGESLFVGIMIRSDPEYTRHSKYWPGFDDGVSFSFAVNPPL